MRTYWTWQVLGWVGYSAIGITINLLSGGRLVPLLAAHIVFVAASIGLTHLFRREIRKRRASESAATRMWPLLLTGIAVIASVQALLVIGTNTLLSHGRWTATSVTGLWWGMVVATGLWTLLYIRFTERRAHSAREGQLQLALREAELRALESQINPHFLFNCLNSIRALVLIDPPRAQDMLTRLANVLRNSLRHDRNHTVSLAGEIDAVSDYLALETVRFEERLRSEVTVDEAAAQCLVPPMVLQTLVENAIKHGIGQVSGRGKLTIRAALEDGLVRLVVENTGKLASSTAKHPQQLGLRNVRERLRLLYGGQASLKLEEVQDGKVKATVLIPATL